MGLSKFLACFGCGSAPTSEQVANVERSPESPSKANPHIEKPTSISSAPPRHLSGPQLSQRTPSRQLTPTANLSLEGKDEMTAPSLSRGSSFARLSLPLEYVNPEAGTKEDIEISDDILGRKSSYTVISSVDQSGVEALEKNAGQLLGSPPALQGIPVAEEAISSGADAIAGAVASVGAVLQVSASSRSLSAGGSASSSPLTISVQTAPPTPSRPKFEIGSPAAQSSTSCSSESYHSQSSNSELDSQTDLDGISSQTPQSDSLLGPIPPELQGRKCLVLDLDETLVHSSFKYIPDADFLIPVDIDGRVHNVFVCKRPGVDEFLKRVGELFEVVVFTASVSKYGDPLLNYLDTEGVIHHRLFRESCYNYNGNYIKNLSMLGRPLKDVIIIDNSPASYALQPQHAVPVSTWFSDIHDNELLDMLPLLSDLTTKSVQDVSAVLDIEIH